MNEKPKSQKGIKRIRGAAGQKGKPLFIPFYVDLDKLKSFIAAEKESFLKARTAEKLKALDDELNEQLDNWKSELNHDDIRRFYCTVWPCFK